MRAGCKATSRPLLLTQHTVESNSRQGEHDFISGETFSNSHRSPNYGQPTVSHPNIRPPSPPIDPQLGFDGPFQSPATSHSSTATGAHYPSGAFGSLDSPIKQQNSPRPFPHPSTIPQSSSQKAHASSPYSESPSSNATYVYSVPVSSAPQAEYYQRPPATNFSPDLPARGNPATPTSSETSPVDPNNSQWQQQHQHHHYIAPSASSSFQGQTSDRYVCQVCNKAFSRPSSLRIHSHSHTGEKPFVCQHRGCGKAFSVRSNMKRHERGCHGNGGTTEEQ